MTTTYKVVWGDTLTAIAKKYNTTVNKLVALNNISNPNYIVVGQILKIDGTADKVATNKTSKATIRVFGLQSNTDRTMYATWTWDKSHTDKYQVKWYYATGDGVWFIGEDSTVTAKQSLYSAPSNATQVKFTVKPISKKRTVNKKETSYWTAAWSTAKTYAFKNNPPSTPPVPTVEIDKYTLTASLENLDVNATQIEFKILRFVGDKLNSYKTGKATIKNGHAAFSCTVAAGYEYTAQCRAIRGKLYSDWTDYDTSMAGTPPSAPSRITACQSASLTSVYVEWPVVKNATSYEIEYAEESRYFDKSDATTVKSGITSNMFEVTNLETGKEYFFRVRACNDKGESNWTAIKSVVIGKGPAAPTTWASSTSVVVGDTLILYWIHNSEDGSKQREAQLELTMPDGEIETHTITIEETEDEENNVTGQEKPEKPYGYNIQTSDYRDGAQISWRVRTKGITDDYGSWSVSRIVNIYAPPSLELSMKSADGSDVNPLESYPFYVDAKPWPENQTPLTYHVSIVSNEEKPYETVDSVGNVKMVNTGDVVYSKYYDVSDDLKLILSAGSVSLENNISYKLICIVAMDSGLTAEASVDFTVEWSDDNDYEPNAEIALDEKTFATYIRPYCEDENSEPIKDIVLSVYRCNFDGSFTAINEDPIANGNDIFITDPHPALNYARYRIVATSTTNSKVTFCDLPNYPIGGKSVVIQWDENWAPFNTTEEDELETPAWSGSMLILPYNIDVSDNPTPDVSLVEYIGRKHPVAYYGTQLGETSSWSVAIPKSDEETLYGIRRLAVWQGDVYVREPSGSGYWANIQVSYSQNHADPVIPISFEVTRVEGGA